MPEPQHPYLVNIPKGYQYCPDCELLTPHTKEDTEDFTCDVCGNKKDFGYYQCPRCGWEHDPDRDIAPVTIKVKKHIINCPNNSHLLNGHSQGCDCPEVDCYPIQKIFNYKSTPAHWNFECSNAMEWSYDVMCNICNYVFEVEDGNC